MSDVERSAFRDFVRRNHPDRGGDPEAFRAGIAAFGRGGRPVPPAPVTAFHRRSGVGVFLDHWSARRRARHRPPRVQ